jgi:hypothetical protein
VREELADDFVSPDLAESVDDIHRHVVFTIPRYHIRC